jgi:hypothetical protein
MREGDVDDPHSKKLPSYARRKKSEPADLRNGGGSESGSAT